MTGRRICAVAVVGALMVVGCGTGATSPPSERPTPAASRGAHAEVQPKAATLVVGIANEPPSVGAIIPFAGGFNSSFSYGPFNAFLELVDARGAARPYDQQVRA